MWTEICAIMPLTTGLDMFIDEDIEKYEDCIHNCEIYGYEHLIDSYQQSIQELKNKKKELDSMSKFGRWWHCRKQYNNSIKQHNKVLKDIDRRRKQLQGYV